MRSPFFTIGVTDKNSRAAVPTPTPQIPRLGIQRLPTLSGEVYGDVLWYWSFDIERESNQFGGWEWKMGFQLVTRRHSHLKFQ